MKRTTRILLVAAITVAVMVPAIAIAADRFKDVPTSNIFHDDIAWLAEAGITKGCNPPENDEFCPEDPVTRQQMAAFMRRFADYLGTNQSVTANGAEDFIGPITSETLFQQDLLTIEAPAAGGILVNLALNCESKTATTNTRWDVDITINGAQALDKGANLFFDAEAGLSRMVANAAATSFTVVGAGSHDIGVRAESKPLNPNDPTTKGDGNLQCDISQTAMYVP